ncbi:MAG: glutamate racemase [Thermoanaerobaculia bacterium]
MSDARSIGLFDSGVGGLTVLDAVARRLPKENLLYLGDTARLPYGTKSRETVRRYSIRAVTLLLERDVKALVIACNTATALALDAVAAISPVPVVGVVEPGALAAVLRVRALESRGDQEGQAGEGDGNGDGHGKSGARPLAPIAVLATEATIASDAYGLAIRRHDPGRPVVNSACPLFVPLAEEGWVENDVARAAAAHYLAPVGASGARVVVLGCTHYPLLRTVIQDALPEGTLLVDSAESTAEALDRLLSQDARREGDGVSGETHLLVTDSSERLRRVAGRFLGREAAALELVDLP